MCLKIFRKKVDISGMPTMSKQTIIDELYDDIVIHEYWACFVVQNPSYAPSMGDYDWHMKWIEVYQNGIYYLEGGK